jgi:hypothetical protein
VVAAEVAEMTVCVDSVLLALAKAHGSCLHMPVAVLETPPWSTVDKLSGVDLSNAVYRMDRRSRMDLETLRADNEDHRYMG